MFIASWAAADPRLDLEGLARRFPGWRPDDAWQAGDPAGLRGKVAKEAGFRLRLAEGDDPGVVVSKALGELERHREVLEQLNAEGIVSTLALMVMIELPAVATWLDLSPSDVTRAATLGLGVEIFACIASEEDEA
jgi:hypothetical protein